MSFMDEIRKIPPVTRTLVGATLGITLPVLLQLVAPYKILFVKQYVVERFELWRIPTSFFLGGKDLSLLFDLMMLYQNSNSLESVYYAQRSYDYAWQLTLAMVGILVLNLPLGSFVHFRPLLACLVYVACSLDPNGNVSLFGLVRIPTRYFPYVMPAMDILSGAGPKGAASTLTGLVIGHVWWLLEHHRQGGTTYGRAPGWVKRLVGTGENVVPGTEQAGGAPANAGADARAFGNASAPRGRTLNDGGRRAPEATSSGYQWGSGNRLGT